MITLAGKCSGQTDTCNKIVLNNHGLFFGYCIDLISEKYHIAVENTPVSCYPSTEKELDSIRNNNEFVIESLKELNGKGWYPAFLKELDECQKNLCPFDSLGNFYFRRWGSPNLIFSRSLNHLVAEHKCILQYHLLPVLLKYEWIKIELQASSTPDESQVSFPRAKSCHDFLITEGIAKERITIRDNKTKRSISSHPNDPGNRTVGFRFSGSDEKGN